MSIYLLLFAVTTPMGEACYSLTQHNLYTFYFSPSRHPSGGRTCHPLTQHSLYISRYLLLVTITPPSGSRTRHPLTQHNLYISRYLLLFTVTPPVAESYVLPTHSTQPLHLQSPFTFPVTPPVGEPCHSRAVPMTLHNPQWPRDVLGNSGRGWPFTRW